jgi:hypothetical protein
MITGLFMGWTDPISQQWFPIKKMTWNDGKYYTVYLQGMRSAIAANPSQGTAVKAGLIDLDRLKITNEIEVSFRTRMPVNRPFGDTIRLDRLGLSTDLIQFDPFEYIARSGGRCGGDPCDIFPEVAPDKNGKYHFHFGVGLYEDLDISEYLHRIQIGDQLIVNAGVITHEGYVIGTAPGYINHLLGHQLCSHPQPIDLTVSKVNHDVYKFGKILCCAEVNNRINIPFSDLDYQPLIDTLISSR